MSGGAVVTPRRACPGARTGRRARSGPSTSRPTSAGRACEMDQLVAAGPARQGRHGRRREVVPGLVVPVAARRDDRVDEDGRLPAEPRLVALETDPLLQREKLVEAAPLDVGRDVVGEVGGRGARAGRVRGREDLVVADGFEQGQRRLELGLGLAAEPDDDVRRDGDARDGLADPGQALGVVLDGVLAAHATQDRVRPGLDRQVQVLADRVAVGQRGDEAVGQVPWVRGHEAQAPDRGLAVARAQAVDRPDQLGQVRPSGQIEPAARPARRVDVTEACLRGEIVAVGVHVLPEERDFAITGRRERAGLVDDRRRTGGFVPARG